MESESDKCVSLRVLYCRQRLFITLRVLIGLELDQAKGRFVPPPAVGIRMMAVLVCILNENRRTRVEARKRPIDAKSCERTVGYQRRLCVPYSNVAWYPSIVMFHSHRTLEPHLRSVPATKLNPYHTGHVERLSYTSITAGRLSVYFICPSRGYAPTTSRTLFISFVLSSPPQVDPFSSAFSS